MTTCPSPRNRNRSRRPAPRWVAAVLTVVLVGQAAIAQASPATDEGAAEAPGGSWEILEPANTGIPGDYVYSLAVDAKDRAWVTGDDPIWDEGGLGLRKGSTWRQWTNVDGKAPTHEMGNLTFDADGQAWMSSSIGLLTLERGKVRKVWSTDNAPWPITSVRDFDWDSDGNLWVALANVETVNGGVARYNGTSWKVWTTANGLPWDDPWSQVSELEIDDQDRVWIGSPVMGGAMFDGDEWTALGDGEGYWVTDIAIAPDGTPWYGFSSSGVRTWNGSSWVDRTGQFGSADIGAVTIDRQGRVWVASFGGRIWRWSGSGSSWDLSYDPPSLGAHMYALDFDSQNRPHVGGIGGLDIRNTDGSWSVYNTFNSSLPSRWIDHVMVDDRGDAWVSTAGGGIGMDDGKRWNGFNLYNFGSEPWPWDTDSSTSTAEAPDGTIWASPTNHGVGAWDGENWTAHLPTLSIESLTVARSGDVWAAPDRGEIMRWDGSTWTGMDNPFPTADQYQIVADDRGVVWVAMTGGLLKWTGRRWKTYTRDNSGLPGLYATAVMPEPDSDAVWVGTTEGLARFDGTDWEVYTKADGLPADVINSIAIAPDGHVWIGAFNGSDWPYHGGVGEFDGTTWQSYTRENSPLPHNQVESVDVGPDGRVWAGTASDGIAVITPRR